MDNGIHCNELCRWKNRYCRIAYQRPLVNIYYIKNIDNCQDNLNRFKLLALTNVKNYVKINENTKGDMVMIYEGIKFEPIYNTTTNKQVGWSAKTRLQHVTHVVIPDVLNALPVLEIAPYVWANDNIETLQIPSTIETIGFRAFWKCSSLHTVTIYESDYGKKPCTLSLCGDAFSGCTELKCINGDVMLKLLGIGAFKNCLNLNLSSNTPIYGNLTTAAFLGCQSLKRVYVVGEAVCFSHTALLNCKNLEQIFLDCDNVDFGSRGLSILQDKQFVCKRNCNVMDLVYLGCNVILDIAT